MLVTFGWVLRVGAGRVTGAAGLPRLPASPIASLDHHATPRRAALKDEAWGAVLASAALGLVQLGAAPGGLLFRAGEPPGARLEWTGRRTQGDL